MSKNNYTKEITLSNGVKKTVEKRSIGGEISWRCGGYAYNSYDEMVDDLEHRERVANPKLWADYLLNN